MVARKKKVPLDEAALLHLGRLPPQLRERPSDGPAPGTWAAWPSPVNSAEAARRIQLKKAASAACQCHSQSLCVAFTGFAGLRHAPAPAEAKPRA